MVSLCDNLPIRILIFQPSHYLCVCRPVDSDEVEKCTTHGKEPGHMEADGVKTFPQGGDEQPKKHEPHCDVIMGAALEKE